MLDLLVVVGSILVVILGLYTFMNAFLTAISEAWYRRQNRRRLRKQQ